MAMTNDRRGRNIISTYTYTYTYTSYTSYTSYTVYTYIHTYIHTAAMKKKRVSALGGANPSVPLAPLAPPGAAAMKIYVDLCIHSYKFIYLSMCHSLPRASCNYKTISNIRRSHALCTVPGCHRLAARYARRINFRAA